MLELAKEYARLSEARVLAHKIDGAEIIFVLSSGPKLRMSKEQLETAIGKLTAVDPETVDTLADAPVAKKAKKAKE